ncbi:Transporter mfs1 [Metarhizium anisopliae]
MKTQRQRFKWIGGLSLTRLIKEAANLSSESDDDPENPQSWTQWRKMFVSSVICVYTFTVHCGSSIFVPSEE